MKRHWAAQTTILNELPWMSTFHSAFKIAQVSTEKLKNSRLSCHLIFNTDKTSLIFYLHLGHKAPLMSDEFPSLSLVLMIGLMTITLNGHVTFPPSPHIRLIMLSTLMGQLVEKQETRVQLQLQDPLSSVM